MSLQRWQKVLDNAKKRLHRCIKRAYPIGTRVIVELREKRFAHAEVSGEGCWWNPEYVHMKNLRTGRGFTRHWTNIVKITT